MAPLVVGASALAATAYLGLVDPNEAGHYPLCPTKALTGLDCPFCGGLRATHSLAHGDLVSAIDHNALVALVVVPVMVILWVLWLVREWRGLPSPVPSSGEVPKTLLAQGMSAPWVTWSTVALVIAFTVVRNVSAVPALAWLGSAVG